MRRTDSKFWSVFLLCVFAIVSTGCGESVSSSDVATSGIFADLEAKAGGGGKTNVDIYLKVGGATSNTTLELDEGDKLRLRADGEKYDLSKREAKVVEITGYRGSVPKEAEGTEFKVSLERRDYENAPNSTAELPKPFQIDTPDGGATLSRSEAHAIELSNADGGAVQSYSARGSCIETHLEEVDNTATINIPSGTFEPDGEDDEESCNVTVEVDRTNEGTVDPAYGEGGRFRAIQNRSVTFTSEP